MKGDAGNKWKCKNAEDVSEGVWEGKGSWRLGDTTEPTGTTLRKKWMLETCMKISQFEALWF